MTSAVDRGRNALTQQQQQKSLLGRELFVRRGTFYTPPLVNFQVHVAQTNFSALTLDAYQRVSFAQAITLVATILTAAALLPRMHHPIPQV